MWKEWMIKEFDMMTRRRIKTCLKLQGSKWDEDAPEIWEVFLAVASGSMEDIGGICVERVGLIGNVFESTASLPEGWLRVLSASWWICIGTQNMGNSCIEQSYSWSYSRLSDKCQAFVSLPPPPAWVFGLGEGGVFESLYQGSTILTFGCLPAEHHPLTIKNYSIASHEVLWRKKAKKMRGLILSGNIQNN